MSDPSKPQAPNQGVEQRVLRPQLPGMREAARELAQIGPDNPSMPEHNFKEFLKRLFNPQTGQFDTALWFHVVGEWRKGLNVTGANGALLFTTPPIVASVKTRLGYRTDQQTGKTAPTMQQVTDMAGLQGRRHPMLEDRTMKDGLAHYKPEVQSGLDQAWAAILAKYGLAKSADGGNSGHSADSFLSDEGELL